MRKPDDPTTFTDGDSDETFLGRWSRRKRAGDAEPVQIESSAEQARQPEQETHPELEPGPVARAESAGHPSMRVIRGESFEVDREAPWARDFAAAVVVR